MVVELQAREVIRTQCGRLHDRLGHGIEHELAQLLHAALRPKKQIETAFEHLLLWNVARDRIAVLIALAGQEQRFKLAVKALARHESRLPERHGEYRSERDRRAYHGGIHACSEPTKRTRAVTITSRPRARNRAIS